MKILLSAVSALFFGIPISLCVAVCTSLNNKAWAVFFVVLILFVWSVLSVSILKQVEKKGGAK